MRKDELRARLLATFVVEAREHLEAITTGLERLERGEAAAVEDTFRAMHTLKGAARAVSLGDVERIAQECETLLSRIKDGQRPAADALEPLRAAADAIASMVDTVSNAGAGRGVPTEWHPAAPGVADAAEHIRPSAASGTVRTATAKLDALLVRIEELLSVKLAAAERAREARALVARLAALRRGEKEGGAPGSDLEPALRALEAEARDFATRLARDERAVSASLGELFPEARSLRLSPATSALEGLPRMAREIAASQGKSVDCEVRGAWHEVDRRVLEAVKDPLVHLVRNAVDHGLETAEERVRSGKPARGSLRLSLEMLDGGWIELAVADDGRGLDVQRLREAAVRSRLLDAAGADALPDELALELALRSGVSTSDVITTLSGHGLGLAIALENVERLGGRVRIENRPGAGAAIRITLPASIATFRGVLVSAGRQALLLATSAVERVLGVDPEAVASVEGRPTLIWEGQALPYEPLAGLLGFAERPAPSVRRPCVVVRAGDDRLVLAVDEVVGEQEAMLKELRPPLVRVNGVAAAGLLGSGRLALILRASDLLSAARGPRRRPAPGVEQPGERRRLRVLVVDDSITTRTMEKNLLEASGYDVRVAVDGVDALAVLRAEPCDAVVSDVDMPRMDGFELTQRIRADHARADLPVILVTALETREDRERGLEVGANAYVMKSGFDQTRLLEILRRLA